MTSSPRPSSSIGSEVWAVLETSSPNSAYQDLGCVERVVDVQACSTQVDAAYAKDWRRGVRGSDTRHLRDDVQGAFELVREDVRVFAVRKPPNPLAADVLPGCSRKANAAVQRDRSSLSTTSASMRRPALTSSPESTSALWRAARDASSSQSPGSSGSSSTSVPSGRSVGSSKTSLPALTWAFSVTSSSYHRDRSATIETPRAAAERVDATEKRL